MNAKMTGFLMTAGAVVVGMYAYKAIAGDSEPQWFADFRGVHFPDPAFSGGKRRRRR
tara:strand:- start:1830 stop:2000 length:171 start_codon:yes stop_codon:yes gene_type:complete